MCTCTISNVQSLLRLRGRVDPSTGKIQGLRLHGNTGRTPRNITCIWKNIFTCMIVKLPHMHENTFWRDAAINTNSISTQDMHTKYSRNKSFLKKNVCHEIIFPNHRSSSCILTNLEELSFLTVLAFPKAEERKKRKIRQIIKLMDSESFTNNAKLVQITSE